MLTQCYGWCTRSYLCQHPYKQKQCCRRTGEELVLCLNQHWKIYCWHQDELFSSWSIDLAVNGWFFFGTLEYWLNQLCSTFGVPRTFSSTGLVLLCTVVLQCSVKVAVLQSKGWTSKKGGPRTSLASLVFIVKKIHLSFSDQTRWNKEQLHLFASATLTETVLAELVLSSL